MVIHKSDLAVCGGCRYYREIEGGGIQAWHGECRRHAPMPGTAAKWPIVVGIESACGEFKNDKERVSNG